jgi:hypothetical protein
MQIGPAGLGPGNPVTVTLPWTLAELGDADPDTLEIAHYIGGTWQSLGGATDELTGTTSVTAPFGSPAIHPAVSLYALLVPSSVGGIARPPPVEPAPQPEIPGTGSSDSPDWTTLLLAALATLGVAVLVGWHALRAAKHGPPHT